MLFTPSWFICALLVWHLSTVEISAVPISQESMSNLSPRDYKTLAKNCLIDDYEAWLQRQNEVLLWLALVRIFNYPLDDHDLIHQEAEKFRLQRECLRAVERLPVSVGPG